MNGTSDGFGLEWLPDHQDFRDHTPARCTPPPSLTGDTGDLPALLGELNVQQPTDEEQLRDRIDLADRFPPIGDQGSLGSCTSNAGVG